jgi:hypothetical protein
LTHIKYHKTGYPTWDEFVATFEKQFIGFNVKDQAANEWRNLHLKGKTLDAFMAEFLQLQQQAEITDEQVSIHQFLRGVGNKIAQRAIARDGIPDKLEKLMESIRRHESDRQLLSKLFKGATVPRNPTLRDPYAMDVDAVRITNAERE